MFITHEKPGYVVYLLISTVQYGDIKNALVQRFDIFTWEALARISFVLKSLFTDLPVGKGAGFVHTQEVNLFINQNKKGW